MRIDMQRVMQNRWVKRIGIVLLAYGSVLAMAHISSLHGNPDVFWGYVYFSNNIWSVCLFGAAIWLLNRFAGRPGRRLHAVSGSFGLLFSIAVVFGAYAHYKNDIFGTEDSLLTLTGVILGIALFAVPLLEEVFLLFDRLTAWYEERGRAEPPKKHPGLWFGLSWLLIFCCWIPLFLACWPGNFVYDAPYQLRDVIRHTHSTHHPLAHTLLMGAAYRLGQRAGNVSFGFQFYTLLQMLILSSAFAYCVCYLERRVKARAVVVVSLLWFALFPMHALFAITATKDVLCAAFFLYFMVFVVRTVFDGEKLTWYGYGGMVASGALAMLFRNNVAYAVLGAGIIAALWVKGLGRKASVLAVVGTAYLLCWGGNRLMIAATDATSPDTYRETLSVPLQCLGRVASYRREDLEDSLYEEICLYIREDTIGSYNPYNSDNLKNDANEAMLKTNIVNFLKLWIKVGLAFPDEYVESIVTNTLGYWYPLNQGHYVSADIALYHMLIGEGEEIVKAGYCDWADAFYAPLFWKGEYKELPLMSFLFRNALYFWFFMFFEAWAVYRKSKRALLAGLLPVLYLLSCLCGPMAALRYIYCIIVCVPVIFGVLLGGLWASESLNEKKISEKE
ncbi:MAG: DUF6020 family protein [Roseburia sp.]|nr:DUF6020 family protein [Roseburia sp.]